MSRSPFSRFIIARLAPFLLRHPGVVFIVWFIYFLFPVDLLPEILTGPLGYIDDLAALVLSTVVFRRFQRPPSSPTGAAPAAAERDPRAVLGVSRGASQEEIVQAYRKRMSEYHPDKVAHLGKDLQTTAHEKTMEIRAAYEKLTGRFKN